MLGGFEGRTRRGLQRMRWLDGITDSMDTSLWWTGRPGVLWFMGSQRVGHDWATELNWTELNWTFYLRMNSAPFPLVLPFYVCQAFQWLPWNYHIPPWLLMFRTFTISTADNDPETLRFHLSLQATFVKWFDYLYLNPISHCQYHLYLLIHLPFSMLFL